MAVLRRLHVKTTVPENSSLAKAPVMTQKSFRARTKKKQQHSFTICRRPERACTSFREGQALGIVPKVQKPFALFYSDFKAQASTNVSVTEMMKQAATKWRQLAPEVRQEYQHKYVTALAYQHKAAASFGFKSRHHSSATLPAAVLTPTVVTRFLPQQATELCENKVDFNGTWGMHNDSSKELGKGAYGTVCLVEHLSTGVLHAAKIPRDEDAAECLCKELQAMAALAGHPAFLQSVDASHPNSPIMWVVLPLQGRSAHQHLREQGPLLSDVTHAFANQLLTALSYMSQKGLVHCDVKPHNILWCPLRRHLWVIDFGISEFLPVSDIKGTCTSFPQYYTPNYRAPELWVAPRIRSRLGQLTDFFAAGCTIFEMSTGSKYFQGDSLAQLRSEIIARSGSAKRRQTQETCKIPEPWRQIVWALTEPDWHVRRSELACMKERFHMPTMAWNMSNL